METEIRVNNVNNHFSDLNANMAALINNNNQIQNLNSHRIIFDSQSQRNLNRNNTNKNTNINTILNNNNILIGNNSDRTNNINFNNFDRNSNNMINISINDELSSRRFNNNTNNTNNNSNNINNNRNNNNQIALSSSRSSSAFNTNMSSEINNLAPLALRRFSCHLCHIAFESEREFDFHILSCRDFRNNRMMHNINEILQLVQSINRHFRFEGRLNSLGFLGLDEPEDAFDFIDWSFCEGSEIWKKQGKINITSNLKIFKNFLIRFYAESLIRFITYCVKKKLNTFIISFLYKFKFKEFIKNYLQYVKKNLLGEELKKISKTEIAQVKSLKFWQKRIWFLNYINKNVYDKSSDNTTLVVSRENILEESFNQFMTTHDLDLKKSMQIFFVDEAAIDIGGVYREWYSSLFETIFAEKNGFFIKISDSDKGKHTYFIPVETLTFNNFINRSYEEVLLYYEFIGKIMGKALFDKITIKGNFNKILIKLLIDEKVELEDLEHFDKAVNFIYN